jgi:hypothetical protein
MWSNLKYFIQGLYYLKTFFSPFKPPKIKFYLGKIAHGVPYFLPRRYTKKGVKQNKWFAFNYCGLGYKTKWTPTDYRHEWNPVFSIVFMKLQFCIFIVPVHDTFYWESWLYYNFDTDKNKSKVERLLQCMKGFPNKWEFYNSEGNKEITNYYELILRNKYLKYIEYE